MVNIAFIRGFTTSDKNKRQKECHCQNGKNKEDSFFVGFHNKPRKNLLQGVKNKQNV